MFLDEDFVELAKLILLILIVLLLASRWVHFRVFKSNHPKESIHFRLLTPYPQREMDATGSSSKRNFMMNSNRILYALLLLTGVIAMFVVIPLLA